MTKIDLKRVVKQPAFSTPPPVSAVGLSGAPPLPVGEPMTLKRVSPGERAVLEKYGWKDGDPVPKGLADMIAEDVATTKAEATDLESMPPPCDLRTPALETPKIIPLEKLSPEKRAKYEAVINALNEAKVEQLAAEELGEKYVKGSGQTNPGAINEAIRAANTSARDIKLEFDNDLEEQEATPTPVMRGSKLCKHCGWHEDLPDNTQPTDEDKLMFLQSVMGLIPFTRTFTVYGGRMSITVRTLTPEELDMCFRQVYVDRTENRTANPAEEAEALTRYRMTLQISAVKGPGLMFSGVKDYEVSPTAKDTDVYEYWKIFQQEVDATETMHRTLMGIVSRFNILVQKLEDNIDNPGFWPAID